MAKSLLEFYITLLRECKGQLPPKFEDTPRGVLLALIKDRPTIWNSSAKLNKDDVLASFHQCSTVLSNMHPCFNIWAVIEKWCWVVEIYVRCTLTTPPFDWRYNNTLEWLKPYATVASSYPYLGCISKKRRNELTQMYADPEITRVEKLTTDIEFTPGIFRDELHYLSGDEHLIPCDLDNIIMARTVGSVVHAKRRGRPSKADKRSPVDQFVNLTPQSAQFQKLLENNGVSAISAVSFVEAEEFDDLGFSPSMYQTLIEMIQEKPGIWQQSHPKRGNAEYREQVFDEVAKILTAKYKDAVDLYQLEKMNSTYVRRAWERLRDTYKQEEHLDANSKWKYFQPLQFLSTQLMPAFHIENGFIKSEEPSTSAGFPVLNVASPAGSFQSDDSRMAASSPSVSATQFGAISNGNKSIKVVLDNLVAAQTKKEKFGENGNSVFQPQEFHEIRQLLQANMPKLDIENGGPPPKRVKQEDVSPTGSSRMIVYNNDVRQSAQAPISTWVPPREDLTAKPKDELLSAPPQKRAQATAVIKSGLPLEKQLKKMFQQHPSLIPATIAGTLPQRTNLIGMNPLNMANPALHQQLIFKPTPTTIAAAMPSASLSQIQQHAPPPQQQQSQRLSHQDTQTDETPAPAPPRQPDEKWEMLGRLIASSAREIESRAPLLAADLAKALNDCIYEFTRKSHTSEESKEPSPSPKEAVTAEEQ